MQAGSYSNGVEAAAAGAGASLLTNRVNWQPSRGQTAFIH